MTCGFGDRAFGGTCSSSGTNGVGIINPQRSTDTNPDGFAILNFAWSATFYN